MLRVIHPALWTLVVLHALIIVPFAWILRDGLGPESTDSSGRHALGRWFMTFYAGPILILLVAAAIGAGLIRRSNAKALEGSEESCG